MEKHTEYDNPWKLLGSREVYRNPWIRIREDQVIRPDGKNGIYGVVEFANYALGIVAIDQEGFVHLVGQFRYTLNEYSWELPEGGGLKNRPQLDEAKRELEEETGITADEWVDLGRFHLSNSVTDEEGRIYLARQLHFGKANPDGDEDLRRKRIPLSEAYSHCMQGEITDAVTIIGITRAVDLLSRERAG